MLLVGPALRRESAFAWTQRGARLSGMISTFPGLRRRRPFCCSFSSV